MLFSAEADHKIHNELYDVFSFTNVINFNGVNNHSFHLWFVISITFNIFFLTLRL